MAIIEVKHVTKHFGPKVALDDVSIDIPEGKIFGLLGPNGAGKSTLIRIINRITMATAGEVWFNGRPITDDDVAYQRPSALIPVNAGKQFRNIFSHVRPP